MDQYIKRKLHCKHYGRYVDDFYLVSKDKKFLKKLTNEIEIFMREKLHLDLQTKKTRIINIIYGIEFLGAFVKPYRTYISNDTLKRMKKHLYYFQTENIENQNIESTVNSYLGILSHYKSYKIKIGLFSNTTEIKEHGYFINDYSKFIKIRQ